MYIVDSVAKETVSVDVFKDFIGSSPEILKLKSLLSKVINIDYPILIQGESGTGKTYLAELIHSVSFRKSSRFRDINSSTIPDSLFEGELFGSVSGAFTGARSHAGVFVKNDGGTIFFDEIGEISLMSQAKLLQVLEKKYVYRLGSNEAEKFDVRFVFATNSDLRQKIKKGLFRNDLFWRISTICLYIPPLRDRIEDLPLLVSHILKGKNKILSDDGLKKLMAHNWPGNIRELINCINRACILSDSELISAEKINFYPI